MLALDAKLLSSTTKPADFAYRSLPSQPSSSVAGTKQESRDWLTQKGKTVPRGWLDIIKVHSNYLPNLDQNRTLWKPSNIDRTQHVLGIQETEAQDIAQFWVTGRLQWVNLALSGEYKTWNVKLALTDPHTAILVDFLSPCGILGKAWSKSTLTNLLSLSAQQTAVADQLKLMEEDKEQRHLQSLLEADLYLLAYNKILKTNPDLGCELHLFEKECLVAAEMQVYFYSFPLIKKGVKQQIICFGCKVSI